MVVLTSLWPRSSWMMRMSWPCSSRCVAKDGGRCGSWPPSSHRPRGQPASPPSAPRSDRDGGGPGHRIPFRASGSPGLTCRQKAHESPRLRVARCGVCDTYAAISSYSNRQSTCSSPAYRIAMPETSCAAVDLAFSVVPNCNLFSEICAFIECLSSKYHLYLLKHLHCLRSHQRQD